MNVLDRIRDLARRDLHLDDTQLIASTPLSELKIDSLTFIEFVYKLEEEFGISISDEELRGVTTLGELEQRISAAVAATAKS